MLKLLLLIVALFSIVSISISIRNPVKPSINNNHSTNKSNKKSLTSVLIVANDKKSSKSTKSSSSSSSSTKSTKSSSTPITLNAFDLCLCGAFATAIGDFSMHPVDTIKILQQTSKTALTVLEAARQIFKNGGIGGFYPGVLPYMVADGLSGAIKFATFEVSKTWIEKRTPSKYHPLTNFLCAAGAIIACSVLLVPGEVLKTRLQAGAAKSLAEAVSTTLAQDGIGGLFAGYYATMLRDIPYTIMELGLYENIKLAIRTFQNKSEASQTEELAAAAITGGITSFLTTPLDLIKTKLMMQSTSSIGEYTGVFDAFQNIYASGGIPALFVSSGARVAWLLPFTTIYLGVYELAKRKLLDYKKSLHEKK